MPLTGSPVVFKDIADITPPDGFSSGGFFRSSSILSDLDIAAIKKLY